MTSFSRLKLLRRDQSIQRINLPSLTFKKYGSAAAVILTCYLVAVLLISNHMFNKHYTRLVGEEERYEYSYIVTKDKSEDINSFERRIRLTSGVDSRQDELAKKELIFISKKEYNSGIVQLDETKIEQFRQDEVLYESKHNTYKKSIGKGYLFALRHYEQLGKATKNLISLASLAKNIGTHAVMPFVNNSRFCGTRFGLSWSKYVQAEKNCSIDGKEKKFGYLSDYFDVSDLQYKLTSRGYLSLVTFDEFIKKCTSLNVVIHFLYNDSRNEFNRWYNLTEGDYDRTLKAASRNNGLIDCGFVKNSRIEEFLKVKVERFVCVDPEIIRTAQTLKIHVLKHSRCIGTISWKGLGPKRAHFPSITPALKPSDIRHSSDLINIAHDYIRKKIQRPFIAVHVRSERHLKVGLRKTLKCIDQMIDKLKLRSEMFNLKTIFLASDLRYGSDTLIDKTKAHKRDRVIRSLNENLNDPFRFDPILYGLYDRGKIAIVEMHILSMGESLFTLGGGSFQEWVEDMFLRHNADDRSIVLQTCVNTTNP